MKTKFEKNPLHSLPITKSLSCPGGRFRCGEGAGEPVVWGRGREVEAVLTTTARCMLWGQGRERVTV